MKKILLSIISVLCILSFMACGSKPKDEDPPVDPPIEDPVENPIEDPVEDPVVVVDNTVALSNLNKARDTALKSGAKEKAPEQFDAIEALYNSVKEKADAKVDVSKESDDISSRYLALSAYLNAVETKEKVEKTEKFSIAQKLYDEGCTALSDAEAMFGDPEATGAKLLERSSRASACFNSVLLTVNKQIARDEKEVALNSKKNAESVKAQVSMKDKYNEAVALVRKGDSQYSMQDPSKAYESYKAADEIFDAIFNEVSEKRAAALKAIEDAKKAVEESSKVAASADAENPITAPVEGIEEENTVLLEEDVYEDPSESEVELSSDIDDPVQEAIESKVEEVKTSVEEKVMSVREQAKDAK